MANQKFFFPGPPASGEAMWFLQHRCSGGLPDRSSTLPKVPVPSQQPALPIGVGLSGVWRWAALCRVHSYASKCPPLYGPELARKGKVKEHLSAREAQGFLSGWPFPFIDLSLCLSYFIHVFLSLPYFFSLYLHSYKTLKT